MDNHKMPFHKPLKERKDEVQTIGKKLPQDAINPAHRSLLMVNSPSHGIFSSCVNLGLVLSTCRSYQRASHAVDPSQQRCDRESSHAVDRAVVHSWCIPGAGPGSSTIHQRPDKLAVNLSVPTSFIQRHAIPKVSLSVVVHGGYPTRFANRLSGRWNGLKETIMHEVKPETDVETLVSDSPFLLLHERLLVLARGWVPLRIAKARF